MKKMRLCLSILLMLVFILSPIKASADGMVIKPDPYGNRFDYSVEENQQIFINNENGLEKMIISIGLEEQNSNALWLFPVPAEPQKTVIDVLNSIPKLSGEEITQKAKSQLVDVKKVLQMMQIYTIPFVNLFNTMGTTGGSRKEDLTFSATGETNEIQQDVTVYEHLEKEGITSEIITAKTANGLYDYLKNQGLKIEKGSIPILDYYIGKEYSFVASWIKPQETEKGQRGLFVTFPSKDIFVPLLPTSVYESSTIPISIRIIGYVSPQLFQDIKNYTKTEYYTNGNMYAIYNGADDPTLKNFYNGKKNGFKYTKIDINASSKYLTDDLWITNKPPVKTYYSNFVATQPFAITIILLVLSSIIASIIAGLCVFKELKRKIWKLSLVGLANCLTLFGLVVAIVFTKTKEQVIDKTILEQLEQKGYFWKRKLAAILIIADLPFLFLSMINLIQHFEIFVCLFALIPILIFIFALIIKRIKKEDRPLFDQLRADNYSSWSFQPKDLKKYAFVPIFSISFLIILWLIAKIIELTV